MHGYRAYIVGQDGRTLGRTEFSCADDEAAKERAKQLVDGNDVELWRHDRKIAELKGLRFHPSMPENRIERPEATRPRPRG